MLKDQQLRDVSKVGIIAIIFLILHFIAFAQGVISGLTLAIPILWLAPPVPYVASLAFVIPTLLTAGIIGFILQSFRISKPFQIAITGVALSTIAYSALRVYIDNQAASRMTLAVCSILIFIGVYFAFQKITKLSLAWIISIVLLLMSAYYQPQIAHKVDNEKFTNETNSQFKSAVGTLNFTPYYPDYIPDGLTASKPELFGYRHTGYDNIYVGYTIGTLEIQESAPLTNQDQVMNYTTNCDASAIWFAMTSGPTVRDFELNRSLDNLSRCKVLGKTAEGWSVYGEESANEQYRFYFLDANGTNIVMQYEPKRKPTYSESFEQDIIKIFNSMKPYNKSLLTKGTI